MHKCHQIIITIALLILPGILNAQLRQAGYAVSMATGQSIQGSFTHTVIAGEPGSGVQLAAATRQAFTGYLAGQEITFSFGLRRDSIILSTIYAAMGGEDWVNNNGWLTNPDINAWNGVSLNGNLRVSAINLSANGLDNDLPSAVLGLSNLETLNLANNDISALPDLSGMPALQSVDVRNNRLGFTDIIPNLTLPDFQYAPQKKYGEVYRDTIPKGNDYTIQSPLPGDNNVQWLFEESTLNGATNDSYFIDSINFNSMGAYSVRATNSAVPGLTLESEPQIILASANVQGTAFLEDNITPLSEGEATLFIIKEGPFDSAQTVILGSDGFYNFQNIVLGNYILRVRGDVTEYLQTYYRNDEAWNLGDTLFLRENIEGVDTRMIPVPAPLPPDPENDNVTFGVLEIDTDNFPELFADDPGGRLLARRRVRKAGVSFNRARFTNRTQDEDFELIAYRETDDEGQFSFDNLPDGLYRINFDFPGIPTDPNSFVEFELGQDGDVDENTIELLAEIRPEGIVVEKIEETGILSSMVKSVNAWPNPFHDQFEYQFVLAKNKVRLVTIDVIDMQGRLLHRETKYTQAGSNQLTIKPKGMSAGLYLVVLKNTYTDEALSVHRVVKY